MNHGCCTHEKHKYTVYLNLSVLLFSHCSAGWCWCWFAVREKQCFMTDNRVVTHWKVNNCLVTNNKQKVVSSTLQYWYHISLFFEETYQISIDMSTVIRTCFAYVVWNGSGRYMQMLGNTERTIQILGQRPDGRQNNRGSAAVVAVHLRLWGHPLSICTFAINDL